MDNIEINPTLNDYVLVTDNSVQEFVKLTHNEAKRKNYAFALNKVNKRLVLVSEMPNDVEKPIIILPEGGCAGDK